MTRARLGLTVACGLLAGCNAIWGIDGLSYDATSAGGSTGAGGSGGAATAHTGTTTTSTGTSAGTTTPSGTESGAPSGTATTTTTTTTTTSTVTYVGQTWIISDRAGSDLTGATFETRLYSNNPTYNYGAHISFGADGSPKDVGLLRFALPTLPTGTIVVSAVVELYVQVCTNCEAQGATIQIYEVLEEWAEGNLDGAVGAASMNERLAGVAWTAPGVGAGSRASTPFVADFYPNAQGQFFTFAIPAAIVQGWLDGTRPNYGMSLEYGSGTDGTVLNSSECATSSERPALTLTVSVPQ